MAGQLLSRFRRGSTHREMRAEGVSQLVDVAGHGKATGSLRAFHPVPQGVLAHRPRVAVVEHPRPSKVPDRLQGRSETRGHRDPSRLASLGRTNLAAPVGSGDSELAAPEVGIGQIECDDLVSPKPRLASEQHEREHGGNRF